MINENKLDLQQLTALIQKSHHIERHVDFFNWMHYDINQLLPHDVLLAVWGDFATRDFHYDLSSNLEGIRTQALLKAPGDIDCLVSSLYQRWLENDERWYRINNFHAHNQECNLTSILSQQFCVMQSLLVYGVRNQRSDEDCLYIFMSLEPEIQIKNSLLGLLMPHIDGVLRRIESLQQIQQGDKFDRDADYGLSAREFEILHWVTMGKTNEEISIILSISMNTVKNHLKRIFNKLDVSSRAQAVAKFIPTRQ